MTGPRKGGKKGLYISLNKGEYFIQFPVRKKEKRNYETSTEEERKRKGESEQFGI